MLSYWKIIFFLIVQNSLFVCPTLLDILKIIFLLFILKMAFFAPSNRFKMFFMHGICVGPVSNACCMLYL